MSETSQTVSLSFKVSREFKRKFKVHAASMGMTSKKMLEVAFEEFAEREREPQKMRADPAPDINASPKPDLRQGGPETKILFGKLTRKVFSSKEGDYHVYKLRRFGGGFFNAVYRGSEPPKALKSIEYQLTGSWGWHKEYGKQFEISAFQRSSATSDRGNSELRLVHSARKAIGQFGRSGSGAL